ncbi:antibiotic biosynthesis monooxygenase [Enterovibrio sp. ZSDZ42]|uniref:Antibiotic biosynthesis monooxygenase n=1 Tax=Enterovibrio gelatinilyticus TaxID=2899819 RepID=A0ABT5R0D2_9GAMM|nr:antibiotic biosynthesis monooxygenase [Enterovibrio sp. ZSDZ42]MDD1793729.1 antibiotic biosynthesis monooxygenase [Enterovibrio sp. ZSDZ42]
MIAVIFEVEPYPEHKNAYLDMAASLRESLEAVEGFISIERFQSMTKEGRILSLSFWETEAAISQWREHLQHQIAQQEGKDRLFRDYRIRVADVVRDYGMGKTPNTDTH